MIELGINIDHIATIRQARKGLEPDPLTAALLAEEYGADAITVHVREDRRHMQDDDVRRIKPKLCTRMNFECAVVPAMLALVEEIQPQDVCLVPERREEVTTEGGLDVILGQDKITKAVEQLQSQGMRVSLFIDADIEQIKAALQTGCKAIELHTGPYAHATGAHQLQMLERLQHAADFAFAQGLRVNAGHGLNYQNVGPVAALLSISELNIGHSVVANAVFMGWEKAIKTLKTTMIQARLEAMGKR